MKGIMELTKDCRIYSINAIEPELKHIYAETKTIDWNFMQLLYDYKTQLGRSNFVISYHYAWKKYLSYWWKIIGFLKLLGSIFPLDTHIGIKRENFQGKWVILML